jgi:hypothetical protein
MSGKRGIFVLIAGTIAAIIVTAVIALILTGGTDLKEVGAACDIPEAPEVLAVGDDGDSLTVAGAGQAEAATKAASCVLDELDAPDSVRSKVLDTSALDGRQEDDFNDWQVSWTYQPNAGINLIVEKD